VESPSEVNHHPEYTDALLCVLQPRKIFVQNNTIIINDEVQLKEYPMTPAGVIESFIERNL
jgi:dipeptidyl-peptidase-3